MDYKLSQMDCLLIAASVLSLPLALGMILTGVCGHGVNAGLQIAGGIALAILQAFLFLIVGGLTGRSFGGKIGHDLIRPLMEGYSNQELASEMLQTRAQIASLQSQINPHFLYNTLESIRSKALLHDEEDIATMVETLALLFRYNISRGDESVSIIDELENVKNYIRIQNYRFRDKFSLEINLGEIEKLAEDYVLPPLTLQPLVENAIHHGLEKKVGRGTIWIKGFLSQSKLILQIRDDGTGMDQETLETIRYRLNQEGPAPFQGSGSGGSGIALVNVHRRLRLFFGDDYGLDVMSAPDVGTQVELTLPYLKQECDEHEK